MGKDEGHKGSRFDMEKYNQEKEKIKKQQQDLREKEKHGEQPVHGQWVRGIERLAPKPTVPEKTRAAAFANVPEIDVPSAWNDDPSPETKDILFDLGDENDPNKPPIYMEVPIDWVDPEEVKKSAKLAKKKVEPKQSDSVPLDNFTVDVKQTKQFTKENFLGADNEPEEEVEPETSEPVGDNERGKYRSRVKTEEISLELPASGVEPIEIVEKKVGPAKLGAKEFKNPTVLSQKLEEIFADKIGENGLVKIGLSKENRNLIYIGLSLSKGYDGTYQSIEADVVKFCNDAKADPPSKKDISLTERFLIIKIKLPEQSGYNMVEFRILSSNNLHGSGKLRTRDRGVK